MPEAQPLDFQNTRVTADLAKLRGPGAKADESRRVSQVCATGLARLPARPLDAATATLDLQWKQHELWRQSRPNPRR